MRRLVCCLLFAAALLSSAEVSAGPTLYLLVDGAHCDILRCPSPRPRLVEVDLSEGRIVREISIPTAAVGPTNLPVSADGRYVFWADQPSPSSSAQGLRVVVMPEGDVGLAGPFPYEARFVAHPTKLRAFLPAFQNSVSVIEPYNERSLSFSNCTTGTFTGSSGDGGRVLLNCVLPSSGSLIADVESGAVAGFLSTRFLPAHATLNETGDELIGVEPETIPSTGTYVIRRLSVATGAELGSFTFVAKDGTVFFDRRTARVFLVTFDEALIFDAMTLALLGRIPLPNFTTYSQLVFDPNRPRAYLLRPTLNASYLTILDTGALAVLLDAQVPYPYVRSLAIAPEPPAPVNLQADVSGSQVTLTWEEGVRSPVITAFEIEAGSLSGATDLARFRTSDRTSSIVVDGVPPGQYHVRIRAVNYSGSGPASNEVLVTVPGQSDGAKAQQ